MSLLKRNKEKAIVAVVKPPVKCVISDLCADRNVRDAYFQGIVFAALANDDRVDERERARINELAESLGLTAADVSESIGRLEREDDDGKMLAIEESASQLTDERTAECFLRDFEEIWTLGGGSKEEYADFKGQLKSWMKEGINTTEKTTGADVGSVHSAITSKKVKPTTRAEEQKNLLKVLNRIASEFEWRRSIPLETVQLISKRMSKFDAEKINWPRVVNVILKDEEDEHSALGSRHAIWKVLGLLMMDYEAEESRMIDDLAALISDAAYEDFSDKLRRFIARYLRDRVSF